MLNNQLVAGSGMAWRHQRVVSIYQRMAYGINKQCDNVTTYRNETAMAA